ncbi:MAG: F0F1 ATP synthase subunit A [Brevefilum sp.]|jgi:F-type H+-transporting ATPase subunit a
MDSVIPQIVFYIFGFPITNTVVSTWVMMILVTILAILIIKFKPDAGEMIVEFIEGIIRPMMPSEPNPEKYIPVLGTMAIFVLMANILGIIPLLVSPTSNISTTIALALIIFFAVHIYGIKEKGLFGYIRDLANPIVLFPLEIIGHVSRTVSLSIRLFGNVLSTDFIVAIVISLIPYIAPLPFAALGLLTGVLQAYIFTALSALYIGSAVEIEQREKERQMLKKEIAEAL